MTTDTKLLLAAVLDQLHALTTSTQPQTDRLEALHAIAATIAADTEETVTELRQQGATWTEIGQALHVSRQAAQQRYA